ncbi:MAG: ABC transporter permease [Oceanospirillaceae bacterium]|nr:ABC transporter permease [Oceanospirillaceae bacterium]
MRLADQLQFSLQLFLRQKFRTLMALLAVSIGVMSVLLLTGLSEGARQFVLQEFSLLGKDTLIMLPGRKETQGGLPPLTGESARDLTLEDAAALSRMPEVEYTVPLIAGLTEAYAGGLNRELIVLGSNERLLELRGLALQQGRNLPAGSDQISSPVALIGAEVAQELFPNQNPLGQWLRLADRRFRITGILEPSGVSLGTDMSNAVIIPIQASQQLFNSPGLFRLLIKLYSDDQLKTVQPAMLNLIASRHAGEPDVTLVTQDALLATFDKILGVLTSAVVGIAAISLLVAGVLIMNITLISVTQRTAEIGLLKALGAAENTVLGLFLLEAALLALAGALLGVLFAIGLLTLGHLSWPTLPLQIPLWALLSAVSVALGVALLFAWLPSRRAARMDPVNALRGANSAH